MEYDSGSYRYASKRIVVYGKKGMVCTSQPLAAQAGLEILKQGGSAVDAAIAAAACLPVVEPTCNGLGGDAFAIISTADGALYGLNASGPAPMGLTAQMAREQGYSEMPRIGWLPVTVPGQIGGWAALSRRFGRLPFARLLQPAIAYAREGYPIPPTVAEMWAGDFVKHSGYQGEIFKEWFRVFAPKGRAPRTGEVWGSEEIAATLEDIARTEGETLYRGALAQKIDAYSRATGGYLRASDLAAYAPEWVEPISIDYKGYKVWELPPNCSGMVAQLALATLRGMDLGDREDPATVHAQIEAMKMAFADGMEYIAEPGAMRVKVEDLLSETHAAARRAMIGRRAQQPAPLDPASHGTVYLCAADEEGNMISYIQSNYLGFGSGIVVPGTGLGLQNRGANFSLDESKANCLAPGKRAYHTILPGFLTAADGTPIGPFGVMGAFMQPQGHVQVIMNTIDYHMNPQDALNAPRWQWTHGMTVEVEPEFPEETAAALRGMGHDVVRAADSMNFGRGQIIWREANGVYAGATEPRTDGAVAVW